MQLQRPPRDLRLDILRGWMQVSIFISHAFGTVFAWGIHAAWGLSDSSEQFVFLSGFGLGSVYALKAWRDGAGAAWVDLRRRSLRLFGTHMLVFFAFAAMVLLADMLLAKGEVMRLGWCWLAQAPWFAIPGAAVLLYQPAFMGILPVFIWCMLLLPGFAWLQRWLGDWALALPLGLYAAAQLGLAPPALGGSEIAFNPFAWQVLFLLGAWFGRRALERGQAVRRQPLLLAATLLVVAIGFWARLVEHGFLAGPDLLAMLHQGKDQLALPRLLHALSLAYLAAVLLPRMARVMQARPMQWLAQIGRNSLAVFCTGLFLSYLTALALRLAPRAAWWLDPVMILGGCFLLLLVARGLEARRLRGAVAVAA